MICSEHNKIMILLLNSTAKMIVEMTFQKMTDTLAKGDRVEIRGLGSFEVRKYPAYVGRNPKTGKRIKHRTRTSKPLGPKRC